MYNDMEPVLDTQRCMLYKHKDGFQSFINNFIHYTVKKEKKWNKSTCRIIQKLTHSTTDEKEVLLHNVLETIETQADGNYTCF